MRYQIRHRTTYAYASPAYESFNEVRLRPVSDDQQTCLNFTLTIDPPAPVIQFDDYYGNAVHDFGIPYLHERLTIEAVSDVITFAAADQPLAGPERSDHDDSAMLADVVADDYFADDHAEFLTPSSYVALEYETATISSAILSADPTPSTYGYLRAAAGWVHDNLTYQIGTTTVHSTISEVLAGQAGVCQDFSHLLIALCRHVGLPARYVSGYLGDVAESAASHAWVEAFVPPYGWIGIDATARGPCTGRHVKLAVGRDYGDVSIVRGTYRGGSNSELTVEVTSQQIDETLGIAMTGKAQRGRLVQYQTLGGLRRFQTQQVGSMGQVQGMGGRYHSFDGVHDQFPDDEVPRQQPQQQQQLGS